MKVLYESSLWITWGSLVIVSWLGDTYVDQFIHTLPEKSPLRAADTVVHGLIGAYAYVLCCIISPKLLIPVPFQSNSLKCNNCGNALVSQLIGFLFSFGVAFSTGCIVDLDHIVSDLIQLIKDGPRVPWERGVLHNSFPPVLIATLLYISAVYLESIWSLRLATLLIACVFNHHVRDGIRHGLWFNPIGVTSKLPYWLYLTLTLIIIPLGTSVLAYIILSDSS